MKPTIGNKTPKKDENIKHRAKVVARKQEIMKAKNDYVDNIKLLDEIWDNLEKQNQIYCPYFKGTHSLEREKKQKSKHNIIIGVLVGIIVLLSWIIISCFI